MAIHCIVIALPGVKSIIVTKYNLSLNKAFHLPHFPDNFLLQTPRKVSIEGKHSHSYLHNPKNSRLLISKSNIA
jgi:hypothetical protein